MNENLPDLKAVYFLSKANLKFPQIRSHDSSPTGMNDFAQHLPPCHSRHEIGSKQVSFCAHPEVHIQGHWVSPPICHVCPHHQEPPPANPRILPKDLRHPSIHRNWRENSRLNLDVAAVVISHNYGRFLAETIQSVLAQTHLPQEILVVDDASTDDTRVVAESFRDHNVNYLRIEAGNVHLARKTGYENTTAPILCFLDADDILPCDYLERGLPCFEDYRIAVVYSDVERIGTRNGFSNYPEVFDADELHRQNYIHAGSLVRREAIDVTGAFEIVPSGPSHADWFLWRRILTNGWQARKQPALYRYRFHGRNLSDHHRQDPYALRANLRHEILTLFVPLSGRTGLWPRFAEWLNRQTWPHNQTQLILLDTSGSDPFHRMIKEWVQSSDYPDVRIIQRSFARPGLADEERRDLLIRRLVQAAVAHIYGVMREAVKTPYVWIVEDDILPPDDAAERLITEFDANTVSVSAAIPSRFSGGYVAWDWHGSKRSTRMAAGRTVERIGGNGFGCVVLRRSAIQDSVFTCSPDERNYDIAFYTRLREERRVAKIHWQVLCKHRTVEKNETEQSTNG